MKKYDDLVGNEYGDLRVEGLAEPAANGDRRWTCKCKCGKTTIVLEKNLKRQHTKSCGCRKSPDLTGRVFGKLEVLGRSDKRNSRGARTTPQWECRCECGEITYKATDTLKNPDLSMCSDCAATYATEKARENAGYVDGTQITKIRDMTPYATSTSGYRGIYYESKHNRWRAEIKFQKKRYYLGVFKNKADAIKARQRAEEEIFGKFLEKYGSGSLDEKIRAASSIAEQGRAGDNAPVKDAIPDRF